MKCVETSVSVVGRNEEGMDGFFSQMSKRGRTGSRQVQRFCAKKEWCWVQVKNYVKLTQIVQPSAISSRFQSINRSNGQIVKIFNISNLNF